MASGAFFQWTTKAGLNKALYFDCCLSESTELDSDATENPVEEGANVSDHVKKQLNKISLELFVSNSPIEDVNDRGMSLKSVPLKFERYNAPLPLNPLGAVTSLASAAIGALIGGNDEVNAQVYKFGTDFDAVAETLTILETLRDTAQLIDLVTPKRLHESMFLEKISMTRDAKSGDGATFKIDVKELRKVKVSLVNAPVPTEVRGNVAKNKGSKGAKPVPEGPKKSIAKSIISKLKGK